MFDLALPSTYSLFEELAKILSLNEIQEKLLVHK
jgi:hypothetical protein